MKSAIDTRYDGDGCGRDVGWQRQRHQICGIDVGKQGWRRQRCGMEETESDENVRGQVGWWEHQKQTCDMTGTVDKYRRGYGRGCAGWLGKQHQRCGRDVRLRGKQNICGIMA